MAIRVDVRLHTTLRRKTAEGVIDRLSVELAEGETVADLLQSLEIQMDPDALLLVANGRIVKTDQELRDGDQVRLIPAMSGG